MRRNLTELYHYSAFPNILLHDFTYRCHFSGRKPSGMWISVNSDENNWEDWAIGNDFHTERLKYRYKVELKDNGNILCISTLLELLQFTEFYLRKNYLYLKDYENGKDQIRQSYIPIEKYLEHPEHKGATALDSIDWMAVMREYDGFFVCPYYHSISLDPRLSWFYGWDCSSGCIWNPDVIKSFTLDKEYDYEVAKRRFDSDRP